MRQSQRVTPIEFGSLGWTGDFRTTDGQSWRGPCPQCGGHRRFLVFTDREYPYWNFLCSCCGYKGLANQLLGSKAGKPTDEDRKRWSEMRQAEEQERVQKQQSAMERYLRERIWDVAHAQLTPEDYIWWLKRGVPADMVDAWTLGAIDRILYDKEGQRLSLPSRLAWKPRTPSPLR